jgi:hypothetical protein
MFSNEEKNSDTFSPLFHLSLEDFTFGHPNVITKYSPSNDVNLPMITSIEATVDGFISNYGVEVLGHCFMPM